MLNNAWARKNIKENRKKLLISFNFTIINIFCYIKLYIKKYLHNEIDNSSQLRSFVHFYEFFKYGRYFSTVAK